MHTKSRIASCFCGTQPALKPPTNKSPNRFEKKTGIHTWRGKVMCVPPAYHYVRTWAGMAKQRDHDVAAARTYAHPNPSTQQHDQSKLYSTHAVRQPPSSVAQQGDHPPPPVIYSYHRGRRGKKKTQAAHTTFLVASHAYAKQSPRER